MKRSWLIYLIVILMTMLFTTVVSFAGSSYDKKLYRKEMLRQRKRR